MTIRLSQDRPDFSASFDVVGDPLAAPPESAKYPSKFQVWYKLGYRFAFASAEVKREAGLPRFWTCSEELWAYVEGKIDAYQGNGSRFGDCGVKVDSDRTGLVAPSGILTSEKIGGF